MRASTHAITWLLAGTVTVLAQGPVIPQLEVSLDGHCGNGTTCAGSLFGQCCSKYGNCGSTLDHCGAKCQVGFGHCEDTRGRPSPDGTCGGSNGYTCEGSAFGSCCSIYQFCGSSSDYCEVQNCLPGFGNCERNGSSTIPLPPAHTPGQGFPTSGLGYNHSATCTSAGNCATSTIWVTTTLPPRPTSVPVSATLPPSTVITPTLIASSANPVASSLASASASASACAHSFHKRQENTEFMRVEIDPDCVPCEGQGGSLPYCGADHTTDNYKFTPKTCRTVYYNLNIQNTTQAPDGQSRVVLAVNGQVPGPVLEANWGDDVVVTVNNMLSDNGTSIHFHGIRQLNNAPHDGVPAITQCPIAPGDSFTYKWTATNYGTSWYHSHYAIQAWEGVAGPMIIHGPTSASWDVDAGHIMLQDWSHATVDSMYDMEQDAINGGPRTMDNGLINGMNTWGLDGTKNQTGKRFELETKFEPGKTYLLRIINSAMQGSMKFHIDGHELEVINMDFTNIVPYKTKILNIQIGQRYMVLVKADQKPGNYWMRSDSQKACAANHQADDIKAIIRYADTFDATAMPTSKPYNYVGECVDEPLTSLVPTAQVNAYKDDTIFTKNVSFATTADHLFKWYLSGSTFYSRYEDPTLVRVVADNEAPTYSGNLILDVPNMGEWVYIVVQSAVPLNHPIHLHGHDFLILGSGKGTYTDQPLNLVNPPRRDTANMPAAGWLVLAFETDNPGTWLMHCHIGWHTSMGFALQILEGQDMIKDTVSREDECAMYGTCAKWNEWVASRGFKQHDSGV